MPIQSTPVTTQSTINLSDINIDTDLNMGANSIIGYAKSVDLKEYKLIQLIDYVLETETFDYTGEDDATTGFTSAYESVRSFTPTILTDLVHFNYYPVLRCATYYHNHTNNLNFIPCCSEVSNNNSTKWNNTGVLVAPGTEISKSTTVGGDRAIATPITTNATHYLKLQQFSSSPIVRHIKNYIIDIKKYAKPSTEIPYSTLGLDIRGFILNGGTLSVNGVAYDSNKVSCYYDFENTDTINYTGNVILLIQD